MIQLLLPYDGALENSIFGVWKSPNVSQRLLWSGDISNIFFRDEAKFVELPTPDLTASLVIDPGGDLFLAGCDVSQFFNRLKAPTELIPFLGFPRIKTSLLNLTSVQTNSSSPV